MGGANYLTALELAIITVLILFICFMVKMGVFKQNVSWGNIWIPAVTNLVGFACSCFTPGNLVRSAETAHIGAVRSVILSIYSTFDMMINDMSRWELWVALILLVPVFWTMSGGMKAKLQHPFMFVLYSFLLVSSNMTPPFFAVGNIGAGRLKALGWMEYVVMAIMTVFYLTVWFRQYLEDKIGVSEGENTDGDVMSGVRIPVTSSFIIAVCIAFLFLGSGLSVIPEHDYYSGTSALFAIMDGSVATYKRETQQRLVILRDDRIMDAELMEYSVHPEMLFYWDVTPDKNAWVNQATAIYYNKDSVRLK